jgi:hypothetical protein
VLEGAWAVDAVGCWSNAGECGWYMELGRCSRVGMVCLGRSGVVVVA